LGDDLGDLPSPRVRYPIIVVIIVACHESLVA
jgi:hypothetical protein